MGLQISDTFKKVLFHAGLWSIWLYLSVSSAEPDQVYNKTVLIGSLILLTHIPLFVLNTEWLIPKVLHKKGLAFYLGALAVLLLGFTFLHGIVLGAVNDFLGAPAVRGGRTMKGFIPLVLVAAISTGYGLLNYIVRQEKQREAQQKERLESELSFLRFQISPHFLFNVLNSIVYLIRSKSDLAEPVTLRLSELMRYILYESESAQILLEKEISYLENYIELQKLRFGDDVQISFQTEGDVAEQHIEPMLLIPFVENAFKHGVGMAADPSVSIHLTVDGNALHFSVKNKIAPETSAGKDNVSGIGLKNVRRRLELLYPSMHELRIKTDADWFAVDLQLTLS